MALYCGVDEGSVEYMPEWKLDIYTVFNFINDMGRGEGVHIFRVEGNVTAN